MATIIQLGLFEPMARRSDPVTSWDAAADASRKADTHRARVLATLRAHRDGLTDFELADLLGLQQTSAGKRRGELRDQGLVIDSGRRRPAPSGSLAIVWRAR
jgi:DNA-binding transcriptional ArsR family regulator